MSDLDKLIELYREGAIDTATLLFEFQRRGSLNNSLSIEQIMEKAKGEADEKMRRELVIIEATKKEKPNEEDVAANEPAAE